MDSADNTLKSKLHDVIFGYETLAGKLFDVVLISLIAISVIAVMLDSVSQIHATYGPAIYALEWFFTILFTLEYAVRIYVTPKPREYLLSFYGIVDLLSILPTYLTVLFAASPYLIVIRTLRVLRIFKVLKMFHYVGEANILFSALVNSGRKIVVFLFWVLNLTVIFGTLMFLIEGPENGFTSIPKSIYWAIVTVTTVGYGDIAPHTPLGQAVAALAMIVGYGIIAVPTGIVGAELFTEQRRQDAPAPIARTCQGCELATHEADAAFCKRCGCSL